jgi:hypothetical protein
MITLVRSGMSLLGWDGLVGAWGIVSEQRRDLESESWFNFEPRVDEAQGNQDGK